MATLSEQDRLYLKSKGINPDGFDVFDESELEEVPTSNTQSQVVEKPGMIRRAWDFINTPLTSYLPDKAQELIRQGLRYNPNFDTALSLAQVPRPVIEGLKNTQGQIVESLASPLSLATLGTAGYVSQVPKLATGLGAAFTGLSGYNLAQRPQQYREAQGDLEKQTEAIAGGVADLGFSLLGAHQVKRGVSELNKPPVIESGSVVKEMSNDQGRITSDEFYSTSELNEPLPTPWLQTNDKGNFNVGSKVVDKAIQEKAPQLLTASQLVKRQFLHDQQLGEKLDTPQYQRFDNGVELSQEANQLVDKGVGNGKINRPTGVELQEQPPILGPLEDTVRQPKPLKTSQEIVLGKEPQVTEKSGMFISDKPPIIEETKTQANISEPLKSSAELTSKPGMTLYSGLSAVPEAVRHVVNTMKDINQAAKYLAKQLNIDEATALKMLSAARTSSESPDAVLHMNPIDPLVKTAAKGIGELAKHDPTRPQIDKVSELGPTGQYLAPKLNQFYDKFREYKGQLVNNLEKQLRSSLNFIERNITNKSSQELNKVWVYLNDLQDNGQSTLRLTPKEQQLADAIRANLVTSGQTQINKGIPVWSRNGPRSKQLDPNYVPQVMSLKTLNTLTTKQGKPEFLKARDQFINYQVNKNGLKPQAALKEFNDIIDSFKDTGESNKGSSFGPVDKAAGLGIPREWREMDPLQAMTRYNTRIARRFAYHDAIESDPIARQALGVKNDTMGNPNPQGLNINGAPVDNLSANPHVAPILRDIEAKRSIQELHWDAGNSLLKTVFMQAWSGARDFLATNVLGWQHQMPSQYLNSMLKGWSNITKGLAEGLSKGVIRYDSISFEGIESGVGDVITNLQRARSAVGFLSLRNHFERISRAVTFEQGKYIAADNVYKLASKSSSGDFIGKAQREKFMKDFAYDINWKGKSNLTADELGTIAARYVESVQGTYTYQGLPRATQEGAMSVVLNWNRWNIEKKNNFLKHVVKPLEEGNYWPLVGTLAGTIVGGSVIKEFQQIVSGGRKDKAPTIEEIKKAPKRQTEATFYKLASLADAAGFGGIMTSMVNNLMKVRFGSRPQAMLDLPFIEFAKDNLSLVVQAVEALEAGEEDVGINFLSQFVENNIQNARVAMNLLNEDKKEEAEKSNKTRDYHMFKELSGEHKAYDTSTPNPFVNKAGQEFKQAGVEKAKEIGPMVNKAIQQTVVKSKGNPYTLESNLRGLKQMPITWSPSMDNNPLEFGRYLEYLKQTQGDEAMKKFVVDYLKQKNFNEVKSQLVPSLNVR